MNSRLTVLITIILAAALYRIVPRAPNFSPVAAMALFAGAYLTDKRLALLVPFLALFISDLVLGLHNTMVFVYGAFAITVGIGFWLRKHQSALPIAGAAVSSSVLFYIITNFGAWLMGPLYPPTLEGLMASYVAGIPFFQHTLIGDLVFTAILFGGYELIKRNVFNQVILTK